MKTLLLEISIDMHLVVNAVVFSIIGIIILLGCYLLLDKLTTHSIWKEIGEKGNVAVAITLAAMIMGIAFIIGMSLHG